nr:SBBP repeat-containing protein [Myxococcus sp. MH1]
MRGVNAVAGWALFGALALGGCQGGEPPADGPQEELTSSAQALDNCVNILPVMTSATSPSGIVTSSGGWTSNPTIYEAWKAFDNTSAFWLSTKNVAPAWLAYEFPGLPRIVRRYALSYNNGGITSRAPRNWTFEGWNGSAWVVVDTRSAQTGWAGVERRQFDVASPGAYKKYRLNVTDDNDARAGIETISLNLMEMYECRAFPSVDDLWTNTAGATGGFTRIHDMAGDPAARTYVTGMTNVGLHGSPLVGGMDAFLTARDWNGNVSFHRQLGVPNGIVVGESVARNRRFEEIYVAGYTSGSLQGAPLIGTKDAFLLRYRYTGVHGWTRQVGAPGVGTEGLGVSLDHVDNAFLVGQTDGALPGNTKTGIADGFVSKFNAAGTLLWTRQFGVAGQRTRANRAAADDSGNVYVAGITAGNLDGQVLTGPEDAFIIKYDADGVKQWTRLLGAPGTNASLRDAAVDTNGQLYVTGYSGGGMDGLPVGTPQVATFVARYSPAGTRQWVKELDSGAGNFAWSLFSNPFDNFLYVAGTGHGDVGSPTDTAGGAGHPFVFKMDTAGAIQWIRQTAPAVLGGVEKPVYPMGVVLDEDDNLYLGGYLEGNYEGNTLLGNPDGFVTKLPAIVP